MEHAVNYVLSLFTAPPPLGYPIILIHGWIDRPDGSGLFDVAERVLDDLGITYFTPHIPPQGSIAERSESLMKQVAAKFPGGVVHLIGYSMGGLNARDVAYKSSIRDVGFRVQTVTTIGTPHRGIQYLDSELVKQGITAFTSIMTIFQSQTGTDFGGCYDLLSSSMEKFNAQTPDVEGVEYFSWASQMKYATPTTLLSFAATSKWGPTDGQVNVDSAIWGKHLGTLNGVDHFALNRRASVIKDTIPHLAAAERGKTALVKPLDHNPWRENVSHMESVVDSNGVVFRHAVNEIARQVVSDDTRKVVNKVTRVVATEIPQATLSTSLFVPRLVGRIAGVRF